MEEGAPANATASLPPSYESVLVFLTTLAQWLKHARERLTCRDEVGRHAIAVEVLTRHRERAYERLAESVWRHTAVAGDISTSLFPSASVELAAWVLLRLLVLLLTWWLLMRLVRATTLPRLRARQIAVHPDVHLSTSIGNAQAVEAFIHPDAAQRGINATLLLTVSACVSVACLLILCLLTMHVWVDVVLLRLLQHWTAPLRQAQAWVASHWLWPSNSPQPGSLRAPATPVEQYATSFISVVSGLNSSLFSKLAWLRRVTQQVKLMYLWGMVGGTMLGVALWLLGYSSRLLRTYNTSLPYFEENDPLLCWLGQQEAAAAQQRTNAAFAALLESQHRQERVMERLASSLAPATPRQRQRYLQVTEEGVESHCFVDDAALAAATSDATEDERCNGETAAGGTDAVIIGKGCSGGGDPGKLRVESGPSPDKALAAAFEEAAAAASATRDEGAAEASCGTTPQAGEKEGAATTASRMAKEGESPRS
ncbi:hypothetical protein, conserved [Leishmania donovani]|uniref:Uncharacterized protein n=1 Tax=Leishmania donovani TaxID=5661 RepID=A0A3S7XAV6_LEIDO|nr:hypothetical protein, conserved [Leishmania donovani]AYU83590.1 hypothetical protein LdCL_360030000 [Leishmania donovani]TPP48351.1 hypothetical protein CGC21_13505 [Leishmania donovani]CBZ38681.1 hypothetical protein, conserved [Leishmania donovani]